MLHLVCRCLSVVVLIICVMEVGDTDAQVLASVPIPMDSGETLVWKTNYERGVVCKAPAEGVGIHVDFADVSLTGFTKFTACLLRKNYMFTGGADGTPRVSIVAPVTLTVVQLEALFEHTLKANCLQSRPGDGFVVIEPIAASEAGVGRCATRSAKAEENSAAVAQVTPASAPRSWIKQVGPAAYEIQREALLLALQGPKPLAGQARLLPYYKGGRRLGVKLVGVGYNSVYQAMGLDSADGVIAIDGAVGADLAKLGVALRKAVGASRGKAAVLTIKLHRRGKALTFTYALK